MTSASDFDHAHDLACLYPHRGGEDSDDPLEVSFIPMSGNPQSSQLDVQRPENHALAWCVLAVAFLTSLAITAWLLVRSHYGFDLQDEGFYLVSMANPRDYARTPTQFGFIYHWLYLLVRGDIASLRQMNILGTFGLAWLLAVVFLRQTFGGPGKNHAWGSLPMLMLGAVIAPTSYMVFTLWVSTPNYNTLNLQALLLAGTALLLAETESSRASTTGWLLLGVAGWLSFMAKPTSAAALGLLSLLYLVLAGKKNFRLLTVAILTASALLAISAWLMDGSILVFFHRLKGGAEMWTLLQPKYEVASMLRVDSLAIRGRGLLLKVLLAVTGEVASVFGLIFLIASGKRSLALLGMTWLLALVSTGLALVLGIISIPRISTQQIVLAAFLAIPIGCVAVSIVLSHSKWFSRFSRAEWSMAICFLLFPYACAFGTDTNIWLAGSKAGIFWVLASLIILAPIIPTHVNWRPLLAPAASAQLLIAVLLYGWMEEPAGQPQALRLNQRVVPIGIHDSKLVVGDDMADYLSRLKKLAGNAGFQPGTPLIDMTGYSPGALYALGAQSTGEPWIQGGYPGSDVAAADILTRVSCDEIARTWLLVEDESPFKISREVLQTVGIESAQDFEPVANVYVPRENNNHSELNTQQLLKPTRLPQNAKAACLQQKANIRK